MRSFSRRLVPFHSHDVLTRPHAHTRADDPVAPLHVMARPLQPRYGRPRSGGARSTGRTRTWGLRSRRCPCPYAVPLRRMQWQSAVVIRKPRAVSPSDPSGRPITHPTPDPSWQSRQSKGQAAPAREPERSNTRYVSASEWHVRRGEGGPWFFAAFLFSSSLPEK